MLCNEGELNDKKKQEREAASLIKSGSRKQTWQREKSTSLTYKHSPT